MNKIQSEILNLLLQNCRLTNAATARKLKVPRHVVSYNREQLKRQGIITGNRLVINFEAMGYKEVIIYLKIAQYSEIKDKLENYIINHPNFKWGAEVFPNYNVRAIFVCRDIDELEKISNEIDNLCEGKLLKKQILFGRGLFKKETYVTNDSPEPLTKCTRVELDEKEKVLLRLLFDNPDEKLLELSKKSGLSIESIRQKIEKFQNSGLIDCFTVLFDKRSIGINFWGVLCLKISNLDSQLDKFRNLLYSSTCYGMTRSVFGFWNVEMGATVNSFDEFIVMIRDLEKLYGNNFEDFEIIHHLRKFLDHKLPSVIFG